MNPQERFNNDNQPANPDEESPLSFEVPPHSKPANDNIDEMPELLPFNDLRFMVSEDEWEEWDRTGNDTTLRRILKAREAEAEIILARHLGQAPYFKRTGERLHKYYLLADDDQAWIDGHPYEIEWRKKAA